MSAELVNHKVLTVKEAGFDEAWLQNTICDSPEILRLGDLQLVAKEKIISSGGRLDILLQDRDEERMYEVEVQLGETDPSHIIRTIEYWDLIRKKYPQREHFAVLVAESITKRFFNVIGLLSANIPIIAVQCQIIEIDKKKALVFTTVLNSYEEPDPSSETDPPVDEKYWQQMSSKILNAARLLHEQTRDIYKTATVEFNKWSIVLKVSGYNQIKMRKRSGDTIHFAMKYGKNRDTMFKILEERNIYPDDKYSQIRFTMSTDMIADHVDMFRSLAAENVEWWKNS